MQQIAIGNPIELNRYNYVSSNPVNFIDPSGYTMFDSGLIQNSVSVAQKPSGLYLGIKTRELIAQLVGQVLRMAARQMFNEIADTMRDNEENRVPIAIAFGLGLVRGEIKTFLTISDFYLPLSSSPGAITSRLRQYAVFLFAFQVVRTMVYKSAGGNFSFTATPATNMHAEQHMVQLLRNSDELDSGQYIPVGVSKDDICQVCVQSTGGMPHEEWAGNTRIGVRFDVVINGPKAIFAGFYGLTWGTRRGT